MANDRLTGLDASFLHLEDDAAHMHVGAVMTLEGSPPSHDQIVDGISSRLHLVPRYRQKLAFVPFGQGRPRWVDDPHFNMGYHVRHSALPEPGTEDQLKDLAGRVFSQRLDRDKPLWEMWVVEGLSAAIASRSFRRPTTRWSTACRASTSSASCSTRSPSRPRSPRRASAGCRRRRLRAPSCSPRRWSSA